MDNEAVGLTVILVLWVAWAVAFYLFIVGVGRGRRG